jgi:hypothetical protein
MSNGYDQGVLNNYMGVVGSNNWGQDSQQTTTKPSNVLGGIAGLALTGAELYGSGGLSGLGQAAGIGAGAANSVGLFGGQGPVFNPTYGQYNGGQGLYGSYG